MYDAEIGFPGLTIDGTECSGGEGEPLPLSESYEDMVAEVSWTLDAIGDFDHFRVYLLSSAYDQGSIQSTIDTTRRACNGYTTRK